MSGTGCLVKYQRLTTQNSPAVLALDEEAVLRQAAVAPGAGHAAFLLLLLLGRGFAVGRVLLVGSGVGVGVGVSVGGLVEAASDTIELQPRDDGLGEWGGGRGGRGWGSVVVILTTHNGRLLHLQTMVFRGTRERRIGLGWVEWEGGMEGGQGAQREERRKKRRGEKKTKKNKNKQKKVGLGGVGREGNDKE